MRSRGTSRTLCVTSFLSVARFLYLSWCLLHLIPSCQTDESPPHSATWQVTDSRPARRVHSSVCVSVSILSFFYTTTAACVQSISCHICLDSRRNWQKGRVSERGAFNSQDPRSRTSKCITSVKCEIFQFLWPEIGFQLVCWFCPLVALHISFYCSFRFETNCLRE